MANSKEDIARRGYQAFSEGDMNTLGSLYTDDVVQTMPGKNQLSGEYKGRDNVIGLYGKMFEPPPDSIGSRPDALSDCSTAVLESVKTANSVSVQ